MFKKHTVWSLIVLVLVVSLGYFFLFSPNSPFRAKAELIVETFTSSDTWTTPVGVTSVDVEVWGAGGGGGGTNNGSTGAGGGGGGAYSKSTLSVTPGNNYTVTVGTGGVGGNNANGTDGGDSWFNTTGTILAKGGVKGKKNGDGGNGGAAGSGFGDIKYSGGNGFTLPNAYPAGGGGGSSAGTGVNGNSAISQVGASAPTGGGAGATGGNPGLNGFNASQIGGGGGGGGKKTNPPNINTVGGNGANGKVVITYTAPIPTGTIVIAKETIGGDDNFSFAGDLSPSITTVGGTGQETFSDIDVGVYSVTETVPAGWELTNISCDDEGSSGNTETATATIDLDADEIVTCTFTNTKIPKLTVTKEVINDNEGGIDKVVDDFPLLVSAPEITYVSSGIENEFPAGSYVVSEENAEGYTATFSGDCDENGNVILNAGDVKTCTITNDDNEIPPPPTEDTLELCSDMIDNDEDTFIDLDDDDCFSFTPKLTVIKTVINNSGGDKVFGDFPLFVGETPVNSGEQNNFDPGTYTVSETQDPGYTSEISGNCNSEGSITLAIGNIKSCTITNDDIPPPPPEEDTTPPVSAFDNEKDHVVFPTEILSLNLTGTSTDLSGVQSAEMTIQKVGGIDSVSDYPASSFFDIFNEIDCNSVEPISTEIVALSLVSVNPITVSWQHSFTPDPEDTGIYCFRVNATDDSENANVEETAIAGPIAYIPTVATNEGTISEINIETKSVTITWTTGDLSSSRVIYDTASHPTLGDQPNYGYAFSTAEQNTDPKVTSHSVTISGLTSGTDYFYRTVSAASPESVSEENNFTTLAQGGASGGYLPGFGPQYVAPAPIPATPTPIPAAPALKPLHFSLNLGRWMVHPDVKRLQQFLNSRGFVLTSSGVGSPGNETQVFGPKTENAVKKFQASQGIKQTGYFGPVTRATVNQILEK